MNIDYLIEEIEDRILAQLRSEFDDEQKENRVL